MAACLQVGLKRSLRVWKALYNEHSIGSPLASHDQGLAWQVGSGPLCLPSSAKDSRDRLMGFDKFLHETSQGEGIPMSKVPPELAFNYSGRVLDRDWSSLNPATVQALVCSQDWIRSELEN
ncbi:HAT, C-terminal dimerization domain [Sesbania bispinosa]|nr:HAT, C-terminal dimerization domain [Sesbania bispinosa]